MDKKENKRNLKDLYHPIWILFAITIPQSIFALIAANIYLTINAEFSDKQKILWKIFGLIFIGKIICYTIYSIYRWINKKGVHKFLSFIILITDIAFIYTISYFISDILFGLPTWMFSVENYFLFFATFSVPAFFYAIIFLEKTVRSYLKIKRLWLDFIIAVIIPVFWFFFFKIINNLKFQYKFLQSRIIYHIFIVLFILLTLSFYFFVLRVIIGLYKKNSEKIKKIMPVWTLLFALIFPVCGILLNEMYFPFSLLKNIKQFKYLDNFHFIFGNFSNPLFLIAAVTTGAVLIIPNINNKVLRIVLFILKSVLFTYTLYFFIIFMPFYPFFIFVVAVLGAGFLLISPVVLIIIHLKKLKEDIIYLKSLINKKIIITASLVFMIIIPVVMTIYFFIEKNNLHKALRYVYYPDYDKNAEIKINNKLLTKTLNIIMDSKRNFFTNESKIPLITQLQKKIVLNNLTLSDSKVQMLYKVFNGTDYYIYENRDFLWNFFEFEPPNDTVKILDMKISTEYDEKTGLYHSWVDLDLENSSKTISEFVSYLDLPEGVWIDDYYLYIKNVKKRGILAEKKSVLWTYLQIKNENRDPGIVYYVYNNIVALKVFPFFYNERRKTGFKLIHFEPLVISNNNNKISINTINTLNKPIYTENKNVVYIPANVKNDLTKIRLKPYFHFIIDCSENAQYDKVEFIKRLNKFINDKLIDNNNIKVTLTDYRTKTVDYNNNINSIIMSHNNSGGFYLQRALSEIYYNNFNNQNLYYPIPVIITNKEIINEIENSKDLKEIIPFSIHSNKLYHITNNNNVIQYGFDAFKKNEGIFTSDEIDACKIEIDNNVLYLPVDDKASLKFINLIKPDSFNFNNEKSSGSLLALTGLQRWNILHPEKTEKVWRKIYNNSIKMNVLSANTSFVVFENEAQEKMMLKKQNQIINSKKYLDAGNDMKEEMPEPSLFIVGLILLIIFIVIKILKRKKIQS